jgi:hypothetical protein
MDDAALRAPFILAPEHHLIAPSQVRYSRREIDVVGDEQGLARAEFQDEALVPASVVVVWQYPLDHAPALNLKVAGVLLESAAEDSLAFGESPALRARWLRRAAENAKR